MTLLAIGASVTIPVGDGGAVTVSTNGGQATVTTTPSAGAASTRVLGPLPERVTFGPLTEGGSIVIANASAGALDYDLANSQAAAAFVGTSPQYLADKSGQLYGVAELVSYTKVTATATVKSAPCEFAGFDVIAPGSGGTITVYDNTAVDAAKIVYPTTNLTAGMRVELQFLRQLTVGCHVVIGGTGVDVNVLVN